MKMNFFVKLACLASVMLFLSVNFVRVASIPAQTTAGKFDVDKDVFKEMVKQSYAKFKTLSMRDVQVKIFKDVKKTLKIKLGKLTNFGRFQKVLTEVVKPVAASLINGEDSLNKIKQTSKRYQKAYNTQPNEAVTLEKNIDKEPYNAAIP